MFNESLSSLPMFHLYVLNVHVYRAYKKDSPKEVSMDTSTTFLRHKKHLNVIFGCIHIEPTNKLWRRSVNKVFIKFHRFDRNVHRKLIKEFVYFIFILAFEFVTETVVCVILVLKFSVRVSESWNDILLKISQSHLICIQFESITFSFSSLKKKSWLHSRMCELIIGTK